MLAVGCLVWFKCLVGGVGFVYVLLLSLWMFEVIFAVCVGWFACFVVLVCFGYAV